MTLSVNATEGVKDSFLYAQEGRAVNVLHWTLALLASVVAPMIVVSLLPSATILNELVAMTFWATLVVTFGVSMRREMLLLAGAGPVLTACLLLIGGILASPLWSQATMSDAICSAGAVLGALVLLVLGLAIRQKGYTRSILTALSLGWVLLGLLSFGVSCVQVFLPDLVDGYLIASSPEVGRAFGNVRQPNQLVTLMIWASVSVIWLAEAGRLRHWLGLVLLTCFVLTVVLSASRMGWLGVLILCAWGFLDRRLSRSSRVALLGTALMFACSWILMSVWAHVGEHEFGAANRLAEGAVKSTRYIIWANSLELIRQHPLTGVGWHTFNLSWMLTSFPGRPDEFFDHAHNLPLHLMVELGLPLGLLISGLLCWGLIRAFHSASDSSGQESTGLRCAFMMVAMVVLHSMLEYPLWYLYILLPTAFYLGICLGAEPARILVSRITMSGRMLIFLGGWVFAMGLATFADFMRIAVIYRSSEIDLPLMQRVERAQSAWLFAPLADYVFATNYPPSEAALKAAKRAARHYIDPQLLIVWAQSLHATGDEERARFLVRRIREIPNRLVIKWLAPCTEPAIEKQALPFQCELGSRQFSIDEMLR